MRDKNGYTIFLFVIGVFALLYSLGKLDITQWSEYLIIAVTIVVLNLFPIKLPSGDEFNGISVGFLLLLYKFGIVPCIITTIISEIVYYLWIYRSWRKFNWFRIFVTIGMYFISLMTTMGVILLTKDFHFFIQIFFAACTFEITNHLLMSGVLKTVMGVSITHNFFGKLSELILPIVVSIVVVPHFLSFTNFELLSVELFYTLFFLIIIISFGNQYIRRTVSSHNSSKEFIRLLENRITPMLAGHGMRVGMICSELMDVLKYPKRKRNDLIQIATIHDIGKSLLPSYVFRKRGALTLSEEKEYQSHCEKGAQIIKSIFERDQFEEWVLYHHERWDGNGFPKGLKEKEIPHESRILSLCNQLDHLMIRHQDNETVLNLLQEMSGTFLDPLLVASIDATVISNIRDNVTFPEMVMENKEMEYRDHIVKDKKSQVGKSLFLQFKDDQIVGQDRGISIPLEKIKDLAEKSKATQQSFHESIEHEMQSYEVHFYPQDLEVTIFVHDLTPMFEYRNNLMKQTLESYQNVIRILSEERIHLCLDRQEMEKYIVGDMIDSLAVTSAKDVSACREHVSKYLEQHSNASQRSKILLAISEATTNIIKHATSGEVRIYSNEKKIQVLISDKGSGIPLHELPMTILVSGYSTKHSLGKGFLLMGKCAEKVRVYTSPEGTNILLEFMNVVEQLDGKSLIGNSA